MKNRTWALIIWAVCAYSVCIIMIVAAGCSKKTQKASVLPDHGAPAVVAAQQAVSQKEDSGVLTMGMDKGETVTIGGETIYFAFDDAKIRPSETEKIATIFGKLNKNSVVSLIGGCSPEGSDEYNMGLGLSRAEAVKSAILAYGSDCAIETNSYGETHLVTDIESEYWKDRRCEIVAK